MYDDDGGEFIVGCCMHKSMKGKMIITTIENSHRQDFEQLCLNSNSSKIKATLTPDWLTGLDFSMLDKKNCKVCDMM